MRRYISDVLSKRGIKHRTDVSAATLCTFRIGGTVAALAEPCCIGELIEVVSACREENLSFAVIGRGSNVLFADDAIDTVLIRTQALDAIRVLCDGRLRALGGASLAAVCMQAAKAGYSGLEFAAGIPGSVGGGVFMNAGAGENMLSDVVESAEVLWLENGKIETLFNHELGFSYRNSKIQAKNGIVLAATFRLRERTKANAIFQKMNALCALRRERQPLDLPSAGSAFKRPAPDYPLSAELDRLGVKGLAVGGAMVSPKHAGFIVNTGGATARDVMTLMRMIQDKVEKNYGFRPIPEIRLIPEDI